jgi:pSer/pThr/pTyr-binding forkhead associated (FHA) protein
MWILRTGPKSTLTKTFRLVPGKPWTVGRAKGANFILDAALVSRVHCRLTLLPDDTLEVRDLDSTNGTFVNGERVEAAMLTAGDRLGIGRVELLVEQHKD